MANSAAKHDRSSLAVSAMLASLAAPSAVLGDDFYLGMGSYKAEVSIDNFDEGDTVQAFFTGCTFLDGVVMLSAELGKYDLGEFSDAGTEIDSEMIGIGLRLDF